MIKYKMKVNAIAIIVCLLCSVLAQSESIVQIETLFKKHQDALAKQKTATFLSQTDSAQGYEGVGAMFARLKNWKEAVHYLEIAKTRAPKDSKILYKLGIAYHQNKNTEEAVSSFRQALKINPNSQAIVFALGEVLEFSGDRYEARQIYSEVQKKNTKMPGLFSKLCRLHFEESFWKESIAFCSKAVLQNRKDKVSWALLATTYYEFQVRDKAMEAFKKGLVQNPNAGVIYRARGLILFKENSFEQAAQDLGRAFALDPEDDEAAIFFARSLFELGRYNDARIAYIQACMLDRSYRFEFQSKQKELAKRDKDEMAAEYQESLDKIF